MSTARSIRLKNALPLLFCLALAALILGGCQSTYYKAMEKVGIHKRDILVDRVEEARDSQEEAKEQFKTALERFTEVVAVKGGKLEEKYNKLKDEFDLSKKRAEAVASRINSVEDVAEDLFEEWEAELKLYTNDELRRSSLNKLNQTKRRYRKLIKAMRRAEKKMNPVLLAFQDQVLFLKHNLNARAISSLQGELATVEADIGRLVKDMEASIREADQFIKSMGEKS